MATFTSSVEKIGDDASPDYVYYNCDIINNETDNFINGQVVIDPQIRFNETRQAPIISNTEDYHFSIIRFTMNGANRDLPLFIPQIQNGTGQTDVNLTVYSMAVPFSQQFSSAIQTVNISVNPLSRYINYQTETQNPILAPTPRTVANANFLGVWDATRQYTLDDIVSLGTLFYQVRNQPAYNYQLSYPPGSAVSFNSLVWLAVAAVAPNQTPSLTSPVWSLAPPVGVSPNTSPFWAGVSADLGQPQDLSTRYYWVYTYAHFVDLWNQTMFDPTQLASGPGAPSTCAYQDTYKALYAAFSASTALIGYTFPYPTFGDFCNFAGYPPVLYLDEATNVFTIYCDSAVFGTRLTTFTPTLPALPIVGLPTPPRARLFFNANMFGLISNINNLYFNIPSLPDGYTNEILITNKAFQNIADFRVAPYVSGVPPNGYNPLNPDGTPMVPNMLNRVYWLATQDQSSVDSLWSPISSLVFTSTLLGVQTEDVSAPNILGAGNLGNSTATVQAAFQPIITDICVDTGAGVAGADAYRKFLLYSPTAEYRLSDFQTNTELRSIDIQVYWKNRLDNSLNPIYMFNLSSVSLKVMFRKKTSPRKTEYR